MKGLEIQHFYADPTVRTAIASYANCNGTAKLVVVTNVVSKNASFEVHVKIKNKVEEVVLPFMEISHAIPAYNQTIGELRQSIIPECIERDGRILFAANMGNEIEFPEPYMSGSSEEQEE